MKRQFQPLPHSVGPRADYDVIVIGAGIGGLLAANLLAREQLKVLLIEQHYMVGGYCSTFRRQGFVFDAASHFYPLLGNPRTVSGKLLADLGVQTQWIRMDPVDQFHFPDGSRFAASADFATYLEDVKRRFPAERDAVQRFFRLARQLYLWGVLYYFRNKLPRGLTPYLSMTVREALDQHFQSEALKLLLTADCPHWGTPPSRTSFVFDSMLRLSYFEGNYYPRGGSQRFADELAVRFQQRGGEILMKSRVQHIHVQQGAAGGVTVTIGPQHNRRAVKVRATAVLSNADMRLTTEQLLDPDVLPQDYLNRVRGLRPTLPCFLSHVGVSGIPRETLQLLHGYYWREWNSDHLTQGAFDFKIFVPTLYDPSMAPRGDDVIIIQKVTGQDYRQVNDWPAHKAETERFILEELEHRVPGFHKHIRVCLSATARTSWRFTLNFQGAMLGWEMSPDQLGPERPDIVSPIKHLYFVGQWTRPGGGITPVIVSAMRCAREVLQRSFGKA